MAIYSGKQMSGFNFEAEGYGSETYARSLDFAGEPIMLQKSGSWLLKRSVPNTPFHDAMGCYPLMCCHDWGQLAGDIDAAGHDLVSVVAVTDPLGQYSAGVELKKAFPDLMRPYKQHYITDLGRSPSDYISSHHRRYARHALKNLRIEHVENPLELIDTWTELYSILVERHGISGISRFTKECFYHQLNVPGIFVLRALEDEVTVGMTLWYLQGNHAYYHLGAYSPSGYASRASYAIFSKAIEFFSDAGYSTLVLGAGAGLDDKVDGLTMFKQGWATGTKTAYLCGRIFDKKRYEQLAASLNYSQSNSQAESFFPIYRAAN